MTPNLSSAAALRYQARCVPHAVALRYGDQTVTFQQLADRVDRVAAGLAERGVCFGDRIGYLGFNSPTLLELMLAASHLGAVFLPVNFRLAAEEVCYILGDAGVHTLIVEEGHRQLVESISDRTPVRHHLLVDTDPAVPSDPAALDRDFWRPYSQLPAASEPAAGPVHLAADDLVALMYTSGTTGHPKGVMLTAGNIWWNNLNVQTVTHTAPGEVTLAVAPLFHIGGLNAFTLGTLLRGGCVVIHRSFDAPAVLTDLVRHGVRSIFAVPAMFAVLARTPGFAEADLSALRAAVVAGAPVPATLVRDYHAHGINLQQAWGLTETAPFATYLPIQLTSAKAGSAGFPMPYTQVRVVDPATRAPVSQPGTAGEICVKGPNVTPGYWGNPIANRDSFDDEGWFHTGDVGYFDPDGCLYIIDRIKEMIITGGENVYPAEVERVLSAHPDVLDVAVVGVPDQKWGETVIAVIEPRDGVAVSVDSVRAYGGDHLARYKLPTTVLCLPQIPRNGSGKLDKLALRRWVNEQVTADRTGTE